MTSSFKNLLKETFSDLNGLTPDKLTNLVDETMKYFADIQGKLASSDPSHREAAMKESLELKEMLEKQMANLCEATGLDPSQLALYADDFSNMSPEEKKAIEGMQEKMKILQPGLAKKEGHKKKRHTLKIVG